MSRRDGNRRGVEWKVRKINPEESPAPTPRKHTEAGSTRSNQQVANRPQATTSHSNTKLEDAVRTAIAAWHAGQQYAQQTGFQMAPITSEDIRALTITWFIQESRGRAR
ncbi:MAG: hypothetical protein JXA57_14825 [Armatimonadetes bacterium]|nr:hypothetical protein [Armatimonadota bacterium]